MEHEPVNTSTNITEECTVQDHDFAELSQNISLTCPGCQEAIIEKVKFCQGCGYYLGEIFFRQPTLNPIRIHSRIQDQFFQQDSMGILHLKLQNRTGKSMSRMEVVIDSDMIDISVMKPCQKSLIPDGKEVNVRLNLMPRYNGELLIKIFVTYWETDDQPSVLEAEAAIYVRRPDPGQGPIVIDRSVHIDGKEAYGVDASGTININFNDKINADISVPRHFKEGDWRDLPLKWSHESTKILRDRVKPEIRHSSRRIPGSALEKPVKGAWMRFELPDRTMLRYYLHFRTEVRIGKDPGQDIICWSPESEGKGNKQYKCISRDHLTLKLDSDTCWLIDHSSNGTYLDSHRLNKDKIQIKNGQIFNLAGVYPFKFFEFRDFYPVQAQVQHALFSFADLQKSCIRLSQVRKNMHDLPLNAVKLKRFGDQDDLEYIVVIRELDVGSAKGNPLCLPCDEISELHARLILHDNTLHLADLGSTEGTWVNQDRLLPYVGRPIFDNDVLKLGNVSCTIRFIHDR